MTNDNRRPVVVAERVFGRSFYQRRRVVESLRPPVRRPRRRATGTEEIGRDDPFLRYMSAHRCAQEVYTDSVTSPAPPLRRCKLAVLCAMLHVEDEPYARCIGEPLGGRRSGT
mgnify:CR=1 FL=1